MGASRDWKQWRWVERSRRTRPVASVARLGDRRRQGKEALGGRGFTRPWEAPVGSNPGAKERGRCWPRKSCRQWGGARLRTEPHGRGAKTSGRRQKELRFAPQAELTKLPRRRRCAWWFGGPFEGRVRGREGVCFDASIEDELDGLTDAASSLRAALNWPRSASASFQGVSAQSRSCAVGARGSGSLGAGTLGSGSWHRPVRFAMGRRVGAGARGPTLSGHEFAAIGEAVAAPGKWTRCAPRGAKFGAGWGARWGAGWGARWGAGWGAGWGAAGAMG